MSASDNVQRRQFEIATSTRTGLEDDEWLHGSSGWRDIMSDRHLYESDDGSSGPGAYLTKSEGWASEYGKPMRFKVDLEGAKIGEVRTGQEEIDMAGDPSYDALVHYRGDEKRMLVLRDTNRITRGGLA